MVDTKVDIRLTSLVKMLSEGHTQVSIARELKVSRQAVSKTVNRLRKQGLITEAPESSYHLKFYHVNPILTMSEGRLTRGQYNLVFDPHNYGLKFRIVPGFEGKMLTGKVIHKRNWDAQTLNYLSVNFEKTTRHLIGKIDERLQFIIRDSRDAENARATVHSIITTAASKVAEEYDMQVDLLKPVVCGMELGIRDPLISAPGIAYRADTHKKVYPNDNKIEFTDEVAMKNFVDNRVYDNKIDEVLNVTADLSVNIAKHLEVLTDMKDTLQAIRLLAQQKRRREAAKGHVSPEQLKERNEWLSAVIEGKEGK